jgi:hypothetical protein
MANNTGAFSRNHRARLARLACVLLLSAQSAVAAPPTSAQS